ncbi:MAG: WYL domain-containing protein [Cyclobacteriaceae bacterium]|nr:WYL domain-containing protein [Cyclobacteriaceae bacterium]
MEEITQLLWQASESRKACRITLHGEPLSRVVHPYGICCTTANHIVLVCWQVLGFTKAGGRVGFRNLKLQDIEEVELLDTPFQVEPGFNANDAQYKEWVYHI